MLIIMNIEGIDIQLPGNKGLVALLVVLVTIITFRSFPSAKLNEVADE